MKSSPVVCVKIRVGLRWKNRKAFVSVKQLMMVNNNTHSNVKIIYYEQEQSYSGKHLLISVYVAVKQLCVVFELFFSSDKLKSLL